MILKEYLGDSVYAHFDGWHIVLTTENGSFATNRIALEPEVIRALLEYQKRVIASFQNESTPTPPPQG